MEPTIIVAIIALGGSVVTPIVLNRLNRKDTKDDNRDQNIQKLVEVLDDVREIKNDLKEVKKDSRYNTHAIECLKRSQAKQIQNTLLCDMNRYEAQGYVNIKEEDNFIELYDSYINDLQANGLVRKKYQIVEKLPRK